jgi:hypothetical protein
VVGEEEGVEFFTRYVPDKQPSALLVPEDDKLPWQCYTKPRAAHATMRKRPQPARRFLRYFVTM